MSRYDGTMRIHRPSIRRPSTVTIAALLATVAALLLTASEAPASPAAQEPAGSSLKPEGSSKLMASVNPGPPPTGPVAPVRPAPIPRRPPLARAHRLAISLGFGFGSADLERYHAFIDEQMMPVLNKAGITLQEEPKSNFQINAEVAFRYYFPYYAMAQVGYGAIYNWVTVDINAYNTLHSYNLIMEVPILVGGYYTFIDRLYVFAAVGPSVFFYPRMWWDIEPSGNAPDFKGDSGVGFTFLTGADFMVAEHLGVGLELRYRHLSAEPISHDKGGVEIPGYALDLSGVSVGIVLRAYAL